MMRLAHGLVILGVLTAPAAAQTPPSAAELAAYQGLHLLAARGTWRQPGKRLRRAHSQT